MSPPRTRSLPPRRVSLFGKLPSALDFVRLHHDYPAAIALDAFLQAAVQQLAQQRGGWPAARVRFLLQPADAELGLIGAFARSRDRAGRHFPIALFAPLPAAALARRLALIPETYAPFFDAVDGLLARLPALSRDALDDALAELPLPRSGALEALAEAHTARSSLTPPVPSPRAVQRAMSQARALASERAPVLDCVLRASGDTATWLAMIARARGPMPHAPSAFWSPEAGRLLIALGGPPPQLPLWLADPLRKHDRLWPLGALDVSEEVPAT